MQLRLFNHTTPTVFQASYSETSECIGRLFTDAAECRLGRTNDELVAIFDSRFLGGPDLGLPDEVPLIYRVRDPDFAPFAYGLRSDGRVKVKSTSRTLVLPKVLSSSRQVFGTRLRYDPTDAQDALDWAGVFGLDKLDERQQEHAISIVTESWGDDWSSRCVVPFELYESKWSIVRGEWIRPFWQNASFSCPVDPTTCGYSSAIPLAILETDQDIELFGFHGPLLILTFCKLCKAFGVENQAD